MMLINLYGGHHDEQEVLCAPGSLRSFWYPRNYLARYSAGAELSYLADHGGHIFARDNEGVQHEK